MIAALAVISLVLTFLSPRAMADALPPLTSAEVVAIEFQNPDRQYSFEPVADLDLTDPVLTLDSPKRSSLRTQIRVQLKGDAADKAIDFQLLSADPISDPVVQDSSTTWTNSMATLSRGFYAINTTKVGYQALQPGVAHVMITVDGYAPLKLEVRFNAGPRDATWPSVPVPTATPTSEPSASEPTTSEPTASEPTTSAPTEPTPSAPVSAPATSFAEPTVWFSKVDGSHVIENNGVIELSVTDAGTFHLGVGDDKDVKVTKWDAVETYQPDGRATETAWHYWIDQGNRFNPRHDTAGMKVRVDYTIGQEAKSREFTLRVLPGDIEELRVLVDGRQLTSDDPLEVQGSAWAQVSVEGRPAGSSEFTVLPETAYRVVDQPGILVQGSRVQLWEPKTYTITVAMRSQGGARTTFAAHSSYVPVTGLQGEVPAKAEIHLWDSLGKSFVGVRAADTLDAGYTLDVAPDNASNHELKWRALDPEVADYEYRHSAGIVPKRAGLARFEVCSADAPDICQQVAVTFHYRHVLTAVAPVKDITITEGETIEVPIQTTPANASEQRFDWTVDQPGVVNMVDEVRIDPADLNREKWTIHRLTAKAAGVVTLTGVPKDQTMGLAPVTFRVHVVPAGASETSPSAEPTASQPTASQPTAGQPSVDASTAQSEPTGASDRTSLAPDPTATSSTRALPLGLPRTGSVSGAGVLIGLGTLAAASGVMGLRAARRRR